MSKSHRGAVPVPATGVPLSMTVSGSTMTLCGELDLNTRDLLAQAGQEMIRKGLYLSIHDVVIDAAGLRFVDAAGVGALLSLKNKLCAAGLQMRISHPSAQLRRLTCLCQLDAPLGIEPSDSGSGEQASVSRRSALGKHNVDRRSSSALLTGAGTRQ